MKKILCVLMAVLALGCFAGCVDHDDEKCDKCKKETALLNPVIRWEDDKELCVQCAKKEYGDEEYNKLYEKYKDAIEKAGLDD